MVRRGGTHVEVPSGWVQVLRGPRPPSVQWPAKGATNLKFQQERRSSAAPTGGKGSGKVAPRQKVRDAAPLPGRTPEMNRTAAVAKIARIQASLAVLGGRRSRRSGGSQEGAGEGTDASPNPSSRDTDRSKKRMVGADEKIRQAAEALRQAESEKAADIQAVAEAEAFVERLRAQSAQPSITPPSATPNPPNGMEAEVERLRAQVAQLQGQVQDPPAAKRRAVGSGRTVSTMPNTLILCMGGRVPRSDVGCGECGRPQSGSELSNLIAARVERVTELTSPEQRVVCAKGTLGMGSAV